MVAVAPNETKEFQLVPSVVVRGDLKFAGSNSFVSSGTLVFERDDGEEVWREQTTLVNGDFTIDLLPGKYSITFISNAPDLPDRIWTNRRVGSSMTALPADASPPEATSSKSRAP